MKVQFADLALLPEPVLKYFQFALKDGQEVIKKATLNQSGQLRMSVDSSKWMHFSAQHQVQPFVPEFIWNAQIHVWGPLQVQVRDSYSSGIGSGQVEAFKILTSAKSDNTPELNSGALHRYLAEAVWYPTALLPQAGVRWAQIDQHRSLATLQDRDIEVSLEFRFGNRGEVTGIYSPGRWGTFSQGYQKVPWEGEFCEYTEVQGMMIPLRGQVGWHKKGKCETVWRGDIQKASYLFT